MIHSSGMSYEGFWINGKPAEMATKLVILCESPLEIIQGVPFSIEVECQNEDNTKIEGKVLDRSTKFGHTFASLGHL